MTGQQIGLKLRGFNNLLMQGFKTPADPEILFGTFLLYSGPAA
jgi:hypothetical protein